MAGAAGKKEESFLSVWVNPDLNPKDSKEEKHIVLSELYEKIRQDFAEMGRFCRLHRKKQGVTQAALAKIALCTLKDIRLIEKGEPNDEVEFRTMFKVMACLGVEIGFVWDGDPDDPQREENLAILKRIINSQFPKIS